MALNEDLSFLEQLPHEIIIDLLLKLSVADILRLGQSSLTMLNHCQDDTFWKILSINDFGIDHTQKGTWREQYAWFFVKEPNWLLEFACNIQSMQMFSYALARGADNYNDCFVVAAYAGPIEILHKLLDLMFLKKIKPEYNEALVRAALGGQKDHYKMIVKLMQENNLNINYHEVIERMALSLSKNHHLLDYVLNIMLEKNLTPKYNKILARCASCGNLESMKIILDRMFEFHVQIDYQKVLNRIARGQSIEALNAFIDLINQSNIKVDYRAAFSHAIGLNDKRNPLIIEKFLNLVDISYIPSCYYYLAPIDRDLAEYKYYIKEQNLRAMSELLRNENRGFLVANYHELLDLAIKVGNSKIIRLLESKINERPNLNIMEKVISWVADNINIARLLTN